MTRSRVTAAGKTAPRRRWATALVTAAVLTAPLLLLATCGPPTGSELHLASTAAVLRPAPNPSAPAPPGPSEFAAGEFIADDATRLPLRKWLPEGPVKAAILALHGFGDYSNAFDMPATAWAARGIATYAYDQRGFGGAPGRGVWAGEARLVLDAITATRLLRRAYPERPLYLLGESMGGAVAILATTGPISGVLPGPEGTPLADVDGVILSAPAVWGRATMDLIPKLALFAAVRLFPDIAVSGSGLRILASDNIPMLRALARDPLVLKGARIATVYGLVDLMDDAFAAAPRLEAPLLLLYGAHDEVIPRPPISEFVAGLPPAPRQPRRLAYYRRGYHLLLRDLDGAEVAADVASWAFDRSALLPSQADRAGAERPWPPVHDNGG